MRPLKASRFKGSINLERRKRGARPALIQLLAPFDTHASFVIAFQRFSDKPLHNVMLRKEGESVARNFEL